MDALATDLSADVFAIPMDDRSWLVYEPLHGVAFGASEGLCRVCRAS